MADIGANVGAHVGADVAEQGRGKRDRKRPARRAGRKAGESAETQRPHGRQQPSEPAGSRFQVEHESPAVGQRGCEIATLLLVEGHAYRVAAPLDDERDRVTRAR